jgi:hypothetical protein
MVNTCQVFFEYFLKKYIRDMTVLQRLRAKKFRRPSISACCRFLELFLLRQVSFKWVLMGEVKRKAREQI